MGTNTTATPQVTAAVYLRISSDPTGQQLGVQRQREDCLKLCAARGWTPVEFVDNDVSASSGRRRPRYERMLTDIAEGRIGAVVAWDLDRLHRRPIELERFMQIADNHHLALATVSGDVDLSTPQGRLTARLKGAVARHEVEHSSDRKRRAAQQKADRGEPQWRNAFGYLPDGSRTPDPETAPLVKQVYAHVLAGGSISDGVRMLNDAGAFGRKFRRCKRELPDGTTELVRDEHGQPITDIELNPWTPSTLSLFLRAPRNAGLRSHHDEIVGKGNWPALVDESTWRAVQSVLNAPGRAPGRKSVRRHPLTGVLRCGKPGCGGYLSGQWVMQPTGGAPGRPKAGEAKEPHQGQVSHKITYACKTCRGCSVRAELVEPLLYGLVGGRLAQPDAVDLVKAEKLDEAEAEAIRQQLTTLYGELETIGVERGQRLLTGQQAKIATDIVNAEIAKLERRQQDPERLHVFDGIPLGTPEAAVAVLEVSPDRFRAIVDTVMVPTVMPVGKGGSVFDPDRLKPNWRSSDT